MKRKKIQVLKKRLEASALKEAWGRVKDSRRTVLATMLLDLLFLAALYLLNWFANLLFPDPAGLFIGAAYRILLVLVLLIIYAVIIILAYSFFKFLVLQKVRSLFEKKGFDFSVFDAFLFSNLIIFSIYFVVFVLLSLLFITTVRIDALESVRDLFFIVLGLFLYLTVNTAHSLFAQGAYRAGSVVKEGFNMVFGGFRKYLGMICFTVLAFFILAGIYYLFDWIVLKILGNAIAVTWVYLGYAAINTVLIFILAFGLVAFNRVYFYSLVKRIAPKHL